MQSLTLPLAAVMSTSPGQYRRRRSDQSAVAKIADEVQKQFHGILMPVLIGLLAYMANEKMDRFEKRLQSVQANTTQIAVMGDRAISAWREIEALRTKVLENSKAAERGVTTFREHERRLDRCERLLDALRDSSMTLGYWAPPASTVQRFSVDFETELTVPWRVSL